MSTVPVSLSDFEGLLVTEAGVEIPGAAGGLREAMKVDPIEFHQGESGVLALSWECVKVRFEPVAKAEPDGAQRRVHIFRVTGAAFTDADQALSDIASQAERIALAKEAAAGVTRLEFDEGLIDAHDAGDHLDLVVGCKHCDDEVALAEEEADRG